MMQLPFILASFLIIQFKCHIFILKNDFADYKEKHRVAVMF